jgi:hypothetical protein
METRDIGEIKMQTNSDERKYGLSYASRVLVLSLVAMSMNLYTDDDWLKRIWLALYAVFSVYGFRSIKFSDDDEE